MIRINWNRDVDSAVNLAASSMIHSVSLSTEGLSKASTHDSEWSELSPASVDETYRLMVRIDHTRLERSEAPDVSIFLPV